MTMVLTCFDFVTDMVTDMTSSFEKATAYHHILAAEENFARISTVPKPLQLLRTEE